MSFFAKNEPAWVETAKSLSRECDERMITQINPLPGEILIRPFVRGEAWPDKEADAQALATVMVYFGNDEYRLYYLDQRAVEKVYEDGTLVIPKAIAAAAAKSGLTLRPHQYAENVYLPEEKKVYTQ